MPSYKKSRYKLMWNHFAVNLLGIKYTLFYHIVHFLQCAFIYIFILYIFIYLNIFIINLDLLVPHIFNIYTWWSSSLRNIGYNETVCTFCKMKFWYQNVHSKNRTLVKYIIVMSKYAKKFFIHKTGNHRCIVANNA